MDLIEVPIDRTLKINIILKFIHYIALTYSKGIGMLLRECGWKWMEISHEKLNLQFLFDVSLLVSPFLSTPSRLYRFFSFSFSSRKIILFFISLSLFLIIFIPTLVFLSFMRIYRVQIFDRNYNDRNGRFYRSHANLEFRLLFP